MAGLSIGQVGEATATKVETIRYYERIGLLPEPGRTSGNYRNYAREDVHRLAFIRRARELGFSIEDVRELLELAGHRENPCAGIDQIAARHLAMIEGKIATLKRLRRELRTTLATCAGGRIAECRVVQALSPDRLAERKRGARSAAATIRSVSARGHRRRR
jgi:DNA-binding transcriptional MerR regulator